MKKLIIAIFNRAEECEGIVLDERDHNGPQSRAVSLATEDIWPVLETRLERQDQILLDYIQEHMSGIYRPPVFTKLWQNGFMTSQEKDALAEFRTRYTEFLEALLKAPFDRQSLKARVLLGFIYQVYHEVNTPVILQKHIKTLFKGEDLGCVRLNVDFAAQCVGK